MAKQDFFYVKVRVQLNKEVELSEIETIVEELDYSITYNNRLPAPECVCIDDTEIDDFSYSSYDE